MNESVYKVVDSRGRVHLPKEFRGKNRNIWDRPWAHISRRS